MLHRPSPTDVPALFFVRLDVDPIIVTNHLSQNVKIVELTSCRLAFEVLCSFRSTHCQDEDDEESVSIVLLLFFSRKFAWCFVLVSFSVDAL